MGQQSKCFQIFRILLKMNEIIHTFVKFNVGKSLFFIHAIRNVLNVNFDVVN